MEMEIKIFTMSIERKWKLKYLRELAKKIITSSNERKWKIKIFTSSSEGK